MKRKFVSRMESIFLKRFWITLRDGVILRYLEAKQHVIDKIAAEFNKNLHTYISKKMWADHLFDWMSAYGRNGTGSTFLRANDIKGIYKDTLPLPDTFESNKEAVNKILEILRLAIFESGGRI